MTHLSPRHHHPPSSRLAIDAVRRALTRRWPEHRRTRLPGRGRLRELIAAPRTTGALARPASLRRASTADAAGRLVGLLMVRNEDDILPEMLAVATQWFDRIFVLDGTTGSERTARTDAILGACPEVVYVARDSDVSDGGPVRDGARQYLLEEARRRYGVDQWIGVLHADEFMDQDPRPMLASHNPLLDPTIRVRLVHAFLHSSDAERWSDDPAAWESTPIRERIRHAMWPGVPETRFFFDRGSRDYVIEHHSKTVPTSFRAGPIEHGYSIVQHNERTPSQAVDRGVSRNSTGWQNEHYARFLHDVPDVFVDSLDTPTSPFAPEFRADPDGPFRVVDLNDMPVGPIPPSTAPLPGDGLPEHTALAALTDLVTTPGRVGALRWSARARATLPREFHALVDYTARLVTSRRLSDAQRQQVAIEFSERVIHGRAPRGGSASTNAVPSVDERLNTASARRRDAASSPPTDPRHTTSSRNMNHSTHAEIAPITTGERLDVPGIGEIHIGEVVRRNWSHVAPAVGPNGEALFCKQFVDRVGGAHVSGFAGELQTRESLAADELPDVEVVPVTGTVDDRLVMVSPKLDMMTIDSIPVARRADRASAEAVGKALASILEARRLPDEPDRVAVWKGIDPKNIGWDRSGRLWIFDFGPPSILPISDAAGRLMAAGLLSRWVARPGPHLLWPERTILRGVCQPIAKFTTYDEVEKRLVANHELRRREPQRTGKRAVAIRIGLHTVGRVYWSRARHEARRLFQ